MILSGDSIHRILKILRELKIAVDFVNHKKCVDSENVRNFLTNVLDSAILDLQKIKGEL